MYSTCSHTTYAKSAMLNIWVTNTSLHISSFIPFLDSELHSFTAKELPSAPSHLPVSPQDNIFSTLSWTRQPPIYPPGHICPVWQWLQNGPAWEERPSVKISPRLSIHQPPRRGARLQESLPLPGCPATYPDGWLTTSSRFSAESQRAWSGQSWQIGNSNYSW